MEQCNVKPILLKYFWTSSLALYLTVFIAVFVFAVTDHILLFALVFFLFFGVFIVVRVRLHNKYIDSILARELDPYKYSALYREWGVVTSPFIEGVYSSYYMGDYDAAIKICQSKLADPKCAKYQYAYMLFLARAYFDRGDTENLRKINERFRMSLQKEKMRKKSKIGSFISALWICICISVMKSAGFYMKISCKKKRLVV